MARTTDKSKKLDFSNLPGLGGEAAVPAAKAPGAKTAPGALFAYANTQRSEILQENESLKAQVEALAHDAGRVTALVDELAAWDGAKATRLLDPNVVAWSEWANRDEASLLGPEFDEFRNEIASAGGNVQPIKVRPVPPGSSHQYEIVFGHRRHRACRDLGLPVLAVVDNLGDTELFIQMDRENRNRENLSPWEQGCMYSQALERGLFPSNRKLAEAVGADLSQVGKAIALARLPRNIVEAFRTPLDLQFRWAKVLSDAYEADSKMLLARAEAAKGLGPNRSAKAVMDLLTAPATDGVPPAEVATSIMHGDREVGTARIDGKGRVTLSLFAHVISGDQLAMLASAVGAFLDKPVRKRR